jgi:hypothetical protein
MRAFYIETLRIFKTLEDSPDVISRNSRRAIIYSWLRGLLFMEQRHLMD